MHKYGKDSRSRNPRSYLAAFLLCQNIPHTLCMKRVIIVPSLALDDHKCEKMQRFKENESNCFLSKTIDLSYGDRCCRRIGQ